MATGLQFTMDGKSYDIDDFELGDLEWLEEHIGMPLTDDRALRVDEDDGRVRVPDQAQDNPEFTLAEARKIKLSVLDAGTSTASPR